jgi:hypothetical protein
MSGHKTLTPHTIAQAKQLGYTVTEAKSDRLAGIGGEVDALIAYENADDFADLRDCEK